jgi:hypothetical protein
LQERLLEVGNSGSSAGNTPSTFWPTSILGDSLQVVFQNILLESNDEVLQSSERAWKLLLQVTDVLDSWAFYKRKFYNLVYHRMMLTNKTVFIVAVP